MLDIAQGKKLWFNKNSDSKESLCCQEKHDWKSSPHAEKATQVCFLQRFKTTTAATTITITANAKEANRTRFGGDGVGYGDGLGSETLEVSKGAMSG